MNNKRIKELALRVRELQPKTPSKSVLGVAVDDLIAEILNPPFQPFKFFF